MTTREPDLPLLIAACVDDCPTYGRILLAYSGGIDSHVLLHAANTSLLQSGCKNRLSAVHINHQLQAQSDEWQRHCELTCSSLSIPIISMTVDAKPDNGESPEAAARRARYKALEKCMDSNDVLLTAHHQEDQAETVLLQLFRGAGPAGLSAMPRSRPFADGYHCRPFLDVPKRTISDYAVREALHYIDDPSNLSLQFDRNYLRHELIPRIVERWPAAVETISRSAKHSAESQMLNAMLAAADSDLTVSDTQSVNLEALSALPTARQKNVLRHWLHTRTGRFPSSQSLREIIDCVISAKEDAEPRVDIENYAVRRYRGALYVTQGRSILPVDWSVRWENRRKALDIPELGVNLPPTVLPDDVPKNACIEVRTRRGGESVRLQGRPRKSLKSVLQESGVPPWLRDQLPLIFIDGELVLVYGLDKFLFNKKDN